MTSIDLFATGKDFHLKEYESLKKEITDLVEHSRKIEIYAVGALAGFYAWFINNDPPRVALLIPIMLALLGGFRSYAVLIRIGEIAAYIRKIECVLALKELHLCGWESHRRRLRAKRFHYKWLRLAPFFTSAAVFWLVLTAVSFVSWWYLPCITYM